MCHSLLPFVMNLDNPRYVEEVYDNPLFMLFANGSLVIQTFFVMSGFLLAYNIQLYAETHRLSWTVLPRGALNRWLRLTPVYAIVLALTGTWLRHAGTGPLWQALVGAEAEDCRRDWWLNLLFVNNYFDNSHCMPQSWYLAADIQLQVVGLAVFALVGGGRGRSVVLSLLLLAGVLLPAAITYYQDLDGFLLMTPELPRNLFETDPTFNHTYRRGHTNLAGFVIGIGLALLIYHWQKTDYKFPKIMKHRYIYWLTFPAMCALIMLGSIFYLDGPRLPVYVRAIYAGLIRPVFAAILAVSIIGMVFKLENLNRGILEWRGWTVPSRVSYCAYILHVAFIRLLTATRTTLLHASVLHLFEIVLSAIILSFLVAVPVHLLVEAPLQRLAKLTRAPSKIVPHHGGDKDKNNVQSSHI